jgi:hypothetical protein
MPMCGGPQALKKPWSLGSVSVFTPGNVERTMSDVSRRRLAEYQWPNLAAWYFSLRVGRSASRGSDFSYIALAGYST